MVVAVESVIGVALGLIAGYYGGKIDRIILFITDLTWAMPPLIMALAIVTMLGPSLNNVVIAIAVVSWAQFTRIVHKDPGTKNMPLLRQLVLLAKVILTSLQDIYCPTYCLQL